MNPLAEDLDHVLAHTEGLWQELRGQRLFITGGTGFFGCWLLESFVWANDQLGLGAEAVVLTRHPSAFRQRVPRLANHPAIRLHEGEITRFDFPEGQFSHVIHAASELSVAQPSNPMGLMRNSLEGVWRILDFARQRGIAGLLFTSSGAVHGPPVPGRSRLREDDGASAFPLEPRWAYGEAKRAAEMICALSDRQGGVQTKIARGFAFIGPYLPLNAHFAAGNFIRDAVNGAGIAVRGGGRAVRSYLYGADLAIWLWTILFRGAPARPYNLGSDAAVSVLELAQAVARECEPPPPVKVIGAATEQETMDVYVPDIGRARNELGLDVFVPLPEAIRRTLRWHRTRGVAAQESTLGPRGEVRL